MNDHVLALHLHKEYDTTYVSPEARENQFRGIGITTTLGSIVGALAGFMVLISFVG